MHALSLSFTDYVCFLNKSSKKRTALLLSHCSSTSGYLGNADKFELKRSSDQEERKQGIAFNFLYKQQVRLCLYCRPALNMDYGNRMSLLYSLVPGCVFAPWSQQTQQFKYERLPGGKSREVSVVIHQVILKLNRFGIMHVLINSQELIICFTDNFLF